jgi:hypothetical protein
LLLLLLSTFAVGFPAVGARAAAGQTVDLGTGRVNGHRILGRSIAGVTAALGRPDFRVGVPRHFVIGWGSQQNFAIEVMFRPSGGVERAWSIVFERGPIRDVKAGDLLQPSAALQRAILAKYATVFRLVRPYGCRTKPVCVGDFIARSGPLHLTFGTQPVTGTWVTIFS